MKQTICLCQLPRGPVVQPQSLLLIFTVCHLPPGTSKWNKIEHRLFSHITMNWRGRPLTSHEVIVQSIAATTTRTAMHRTLLKIRKLLEAHGIVIPPATTPPAALASVQARALAQNGDPESKIKTTC